MAISLKDFDFDLKKKQLKISSVNLGFPAKVFVVSHLTRTEIEFRPIDETHPLFDQDQWDGEQKIYAPVQANLCPNVTTLIIYNS